MSSEKKINWMVTGQYIVLQYKDNKPCTIEKGSEKFATIKKMIADGKQQAIIDLMYPTKNIPKYTDGNFVTDDNGNLYVKGDKNPVDISIAKKILEFYKAQLPYAPLIAFWNNLKKNPSKDSQDQLFLFLQANSMPITPDGCFLAYKKVNRNGDGELVDGYTGKIRNDIGSVVKMDRDKVNPDRKQTCSYGLHVAAYDYAKHEYSGHELLEVKVNPLNVVAVPDDYKDQKMRVCEYEVVGINKTKITNIFVDWADLRVKRKTAQKKNETIKAKINDDREAILEQLKETKKGGKVDLDKISAAQIVVLVAHLTGFKITNSTKDRESIIKKAKKVLPEYKFKV